MNHCEICGKPHAQKHHLLTRKRWGKKALVKENEMYLCFPHHMESHTIGQGSFAKKYNLLDRLESAREVVWGEPNE